MTAAQELPPQNLKPAWKTIFFMALVHLGALCALIPGTFSWSGLAVGGVLFWMTGGLGITLGWHRLLTHRSFQLPKFLEYFFAFCGALACEGGVIEWVGLHRNHHLHSDHDQDQHNSRRGFWWSHMGWMLSEIPAKSEIDRLTKDINQDPFYRFLDDHFIWIQVAFGLVLFAIGGWSWVIWGIFVRLVAVYHVTWFVNSATHQFGYRTFESDDYSTNCWWVALLAFGEGWHNNHHTYPHSARHGLQWWEFDLTWETIRLLQILGFAKKVRLVTASGEQRDESV
ncbi:fatty acid desaturase [Thermosynechococcaceae cyanobacterium BACA0444]|uniref:Fatty acid desaturase n=1 Tax=Pseudocalidococcus azoricus BACA0444 TaxID=2918990 RepID=A0AAE4FPF6_9CYAN|nr:fatty acid desaturase [Pseudocalidococcus azoricus]MDS3859696.1 fatty acid desaturase [Pseudocalidococcus azoricus BACA0444]